MKRSFEFSLVACALLIALATNAQAQRPGGGGGCQHGGMGSPISGGGMTSTGGMLGSYQPSPMQQMQQAYLRQQMYAQQQMYIQQEYAIAQEKAAKKERRLANVKQRRIAEQAKRHNASPAVATSQSFTSSSPLPNAKSN